MPVKKVLMIGDPKLRERSIEIGEDAQELKEIIRDLRDTLKKLQKKHGMGRALAAPQIGHMRRVIFFNLPEEELIMVDPRITWKSDDMARVWDSCFSFDLAFFVHILRHEKIKIEFRDQDGNDRKLKLHGDMAELIQHEVDHLDGILASDHLLSNKDIIMRSEWELTIKGDIK
jgi:peptide deformylase